MQKFITDFRKIFYSYQFIGLLLAIKVFFLTFYNLTPPFRHSLNYIKLS